MMDRGELVGRLRELEAAATKGPWEALCLMAKAGRETLFHAGSSNSFQPPRPAEVEANVALTVAMRNALPDLLATVEQQAEEIERLREALTKCEAIFWDYVGLHLAKNTLDGASKADTNRGHAEMCRAALTKEQS